MLPLWGVSGLFTGIEMGGGRGMGKGMRGEGGAGEGRWVVDGVWRVEL